MAVKKERAFPKGAKQAEILERPVNIITFFSKYRENISKIPI